MRYECIRQLQKPLYEFQLNSHSNRKRGTDLYYFRICIFLILSLSQRNIQPLGVYLPLRGGEKGDITKTKRD